MHYNERNAVKVEWVSEWVRGKCRRGTKNKRKKKWLWEKKKLKKEFSVEKWDLRNVVRINHKIMSDANYRRDNFSLEYEMMWRKMSSF